MYIASLQVLLKPVATGLLCGNSELFYWDLNNCVWFTYSREGGEGEKVVVFFFSFLFPSAYQLYLEKSGFNYTKCFILGCSKLKPDPAQISRATSGFGLHICEEPVKLLRVFVLVLPSADW